MNFSPLTPPKPPAPPKQSSDGTSNDSNTTKDVTAILGRNLMSTLSEAQKATNNNITTNKATNKLVSTLSEIRLIISRKGLLRGDLIRAEAFLSKISNAGGSGGGSNSAGPKGGGGKRRKKRGGIGGSGSGGSSGKAFNFVDGSPSTVGHGIADDEGLLLIALGRILGAGKADKNSNECTLPHNVVRESSEVLLAICRHVNTYFSGGGSVCSNAEYELLLPACPQLMSGLGNTAANLLRNTQQHESQDAMDALASCHRAALSLIVLMGTRLSRSTAIMEKITTTASEALFISVGNDIIGKHCLQSAAALLATRPLAGNADGVSPAKLWTGVILQTTKSLTLVLSIYFPMHKSATKARQFVDSHDQAWVDLVEESLTTQEDRTNEFIKRIEGYATVLNSLLDMEGFDGSRAETSISCASVPLGAMLDLVELMLAFPSAAEARYLSTKSHLRDVSIQNGVLSPNSAMFVANNVKCRGLELFDRVLSSTNSSSLVYGRRIIRLASNSLESNCSYALRRSIDPVGTPAVRTDGKRGRRWLHDSLRLRSMSVMAFGRSILRIGASVALTSEGDLVAKGLVFVSGCLLEQTIADDASPEADWGTLSDRIDLASACTDTLGTALSVAGRYLEGPTRSTIESVAATCLSNLSCSDNPGPALSYSSTKCSLLRLAINCICAPWSDGATSNLTGTLRKAAEALKGDKDNEVSTSAYSALCICDAIIARRSPPMVVVSRGADAPSSTVQGGRSGLGFLSSDILDGIQAASKEIQSISNASPPPSSEKRKAEPRDHSFQGVSNEMKRDDKRRKQDKESTSSTTSNYAVDVDIEIDEDESESGKKKKSNDKLTQDQEIQDRSSSMDVESDKEDEAKEPEEDKPKELESNLVNKRKNDEDNDPVATKDTRAKTRTVAQNSSVYVASNRQSKDSEDSDSDMGDFPEIVDVGPDEEDA